VVRILLGDRPYKFDGHHPKIKQKTRISKIIFRSDGFSFYPNQKSFSPNNAQVLEQLKTNRFRSINWQSTSTTQLDSVTRTFAL